MITITISGPQGAGKSSLAKELKDYLQRRLPYSRSGRTVRLEDEEQRFGPEDAEIVIRTEQTL